MKRMLVITCAFGLVIALSTMSVRHYAGDTRDLLKGQPQGDSHTAAEIDPWAAFHGQVLVSVTDVEPIREHLVSLSSASTMRYVSMRLEVSTVELVSAVRFDGTTVPVPNAGSLNAYEVRGVENWESVFSQRRPTKAQPLMALLQYKGGTKSAEFAEWSVVSAFRPSTGDIEFTGPWAETQTSTLKSVRSVANTNGLGEANETDFLKALAAEVGGGKSGPILQLWEVSKKPDAETTWAGKSPLTRFLDPAEAPPSVIARLIETPVVIVVDGTVSQQTPSAIRLRTADGVSVAVPVGSIRSTVISAFLPPGGEVILETIDSSGNNDAAGRPVGLKTLGTFDNSRFRVLKERGEVLSLVVSDQLLKSVDVAEKDLVELAQLRVANYSDVAPKAS